MSIIITIGITVLLLGILAVISVLPNQNRVRSIKLKTDPNAKFVKKEI